MLTFYSFLTKQAKYLFPILILILEIVLTSYLLEVVVESTYMNVSLVLHTILFETIKLFRF